ncbi:MAG: helix-turn-helix transcriptional regulator [Bacillota bacterium]
MKLTTAVSKRIRELLNERGMTQYQLYKKSGVPQSTISTILSEKDKTSKLLTIAQIAQGFDMGLEEFFASANFSFTELDVE